MPPSMRLKDTKELERAFKKCDALTQQRNLEAAVNAGLQPINNAAQENAPFKFGNLRRSIHTEITKSSKNYCEGASGTNLDYALRLEMGFKGVDALGRHYDQPARPYMRPAFDNNKGKAVSEMSDALKEILTKLVPLNQ